MIETAKNLFLIWDGDGEGSLSPDELIKAFVRIGLSQDHQFAKKIMYSIKKISP
jgi:Ca2+-binding EF-hand superfamily protein